MAKNVEPTKDELKDIRELEDDDDWLTDEELAGEFNWQWREVIKNLMDGKRIYQAYAAAYDLDTTNEGSRRVAEANGSRLLRNAKFTALWRHVLVEAGFNDEIADSQLMDLITNPKYEPETRRKALKDFNELRGRIIRRTDLTSGDKPIPILGLKHDIPGGDSAVPGNDGAAENSSPKPTN